jgi:hypothetical protein
MNSNQGHTPWLRLMVLISLLLFKGVATAAMLCCGPDHSNHLMSQPHHQSADTATHQVIDHSAHSAEQHADMVMPQMHDSDPQHNGQQSSCSGCAVSCTTAMVMMDPSGKLPEKNQAERIFSSNSLLFSLTSSGLERPPRF